MHIALVNQFFPPDVAPTGKMLHDLAHELGRAGHAVTVITSRGSYAEGSRFPASEQLDGIEVRRLPVPSGRGIMGKAFSYACFMIGAGCRLLFTRRKPDLVVAQTTPPLIGLIVATIGRLRKFRYAHWVMDLYPDVLVAHGAIRSGSLACRILDRLSRAQFRGSQAVITIGPGMAGRLRPNADGVTWIPLWGSSHQEAGVEERASALRLEHDWGPQETVFMYSGNMGRGHLLEEFLVAAGRLRTDGVAAKFVFSGGGCKRMEVEEYISSDGDLPLELLPYVPLADLPAHLASADVLLASLEPDWNGCMLPSKIQGIFAAGRPAIFVGDPESTPARWIRDAGAGWVVPPDDVEGLVRAAREACVPEERRRRGQAALGYARSQFDREENCRRIRLLLETTAAPGGVGTSRRHVPTGFPKK